ncbi:unnamed protein product [Ostreobium quekettii]|uniref:RRM domain-containing protein n=1 Tax=Ostreobium quekettii TaxID=121088 RepID=A0A8S1J6Q9_9CHLO|nr:unnamed protein product [Ostreobium quekettii]|eukprot:evm.model.scf_397.5 EVM.evm.TU.scf_397.5   scf_397:44416-47828(-)
MSTYHHAVERTIYVGNIGRGVTEQALLALFGHCGTVTQIRLAGDPSFETRYAFIEFGHPDEVRTALLLDGMQVYERSIRVSPARGGGPLRNNDPDRVNKTIHVAGIPMEDIEEDVLAEFFSHCGEVVAVRKSGRFAWVEFATTPGMQAALSLDGEPLGNSNMKVQQSRTPIMNAGWRAPPKDPGRQSSFQSSPAAPEAAPESAYAGHYPYAEQSYGAGGYGNGYTGSCGQSSGDAYGHSMPPPAGPRPTAAPPHAYPPPHSLGPGLPYPVPPQAPMVGGHPSVPPPERGIAGASQGR